MESYFVVLIRLPGGTVGVLVLLFASFKRSVQHSALARAYPPSHVHVQYLFKKRKEKKENIDSLLRCRFISKKKQKNINQQTSYIVPTNGGCEGMRRKRPGKGLAQDLFVIVVIFIICKTNNSSCRFVSINLTLPTANSKQQQLKFSHGNSITGLLTIVVIVIVIVVLFFFFFFVLLFVLLFVFLLCFVLLLFLFVILKNRQPKRSAPILEEKQPEQQTVTAVTYGLSEVGIVCVDVASSSL